MISASDFRNGITFEINGQPHVILEFQHVKPGKGAAFVRTKYKNILTGATREEAFNPNDRFPKAHIEKKKMQYLYDSGDALVFMDEVSYDQIEIQKDKLEWEMNFLTPNLAVDITMYENEILGLILPDKVELQLVECEPAVKGDTATSATKNAKCETGLEIRVPLFIENEERVLVSTADGKYSSRA